MTDSVISYPFLPFHGGYGMLHGCYAEETAVMQIG